MAMKGDEFDPDPFMFATLNGVIELKNAASFRPGRPNDFLSLRTPVPYDANARCPRFIQFLDEVFEHNAPLIAFVQRAVGYCMTGSTQEQVVFCLQGAGENGKSTFIETIAAVLGEYAGALPFASLLHDRNRGVPDDLASIVGTRLVVASEPGQTGRLDEGRIKSMSGEDTLKARPLYGRWFTFVPTFKLWLLFNEQPRVTDASYAMWRRMRVIPFTRRFSGEHRDNHLKETLAAEASGILNWMIRGYLAWERDGLKPPPDVRAAVDSWRDEEDLVADFVRNGCEQDLGHWVSSRDLYGSFLAWCDLEHVAAKDRIARRTFTRRVMNLLEAKKRKTGIGFLGVRLRQGVSL
jgi:putative DNA primase/helicase